MVKNRIINGTAHVYIDDEIGAGGIRGGDIARQILDFKANGLHVRVNINSPGGSVFDGYQIIDAIVETQADTHVSGIAASMAGIIALFGVNRTINDFGVIMIHAPSGGNTDILEIVRKRLSSILLNKTHFKEEQIAEMMEGKKDYFFDAMEAFERGIVTSEPIDTGKKKPVEMAMLDIKEQFEVFNKLNNEINMDSVKNKLSLPANASEADVLNKIEALEGQVNDKNEEILNLGIEKEELEKKVSELEAEKENQVKNAAKVLVKNALEAGKIGEDSVEAWEEAAIENFERTEKQLNAISSNHNAHVVDNNVNNSQKEDLLKPENSQKLVNFMRSEDALKLKEENEQLFNKYQEAYLNI